jgi:hypothetical protein
MTTPALAETVKGQGRHYRHPVTGDLVPSVTNILSMLNKPALVGWAAREVATLAATMRDVLPDMTHEEVVDVLKGAATRTGNRAGSRGTDIHEWLEESLHGRRPPELTGQAVEYVDAAQDWLTRMAPTVITTETTMFSPAYAGTADAVVQMGGQVWLIDFKTSKAVYGEAALQLAALANGTIWHDGTAQVQTVPIDRLGVVRIGRGGVWELQEVVNTASHYATFIALLEVWHWHHTRDKFKEATDVATV